MDNTQSGAWSKPPGEVLGSLGVSPDEGLHTSEIARRRTRHGRNRLREIGRKSVWVILAGQVTSPIMALLAVAAVLSFVFGQGPEGYAIIGVIVLTVAIGFFTEVRAVRSMEALRSMSRVRTAVRRNGSVGEVDATELVPGDIVLVEGGDIVTADLRLFEANRLQTDESALTGESVPVGKSVDPLDGDEPLAGRSNMLFKGTTVTMGSGAGVVVATGMNTELGGISELVETAEKETTPLEKRLDRLGRSLIWVTIGIVVVVAAAGILRGKPLLLMIETAIALAVAAIPEGLPIVATVALARGLVRMARRNALVNRLGSVETLGATNVICADKTGTLTENRMTVANVTVDAREIDVGAAPEELRGAAGRDGGTLYEVLKAGVLCNNASLATEESGQAVGDPLEVALLAAGAEADIRRNELLDTMPEVREVAFEPATRMMATFHRHNGGYYAAVKGAPEAVLGVSTSILTENGPERLDDDRKRDLAGANDRLAENGLRVLAVARRDAADPKSDPYTELTLLGLVGLLDPPRKEVPDAVEACKRAGVRVIMVTGDQAATARYVAAAVGLELGGTGDVVHGREIDELDAPDGRLLGAGVFARVDPKQKLGLISAHQKNGAVVGMTGDGVNDAPALKKADIGIAMGKRGTQVAREASDMILQDDSFPTIVAAIRHGRVIFDNIRKFVLFLLSGNVGEILSVGLAASLALPLPLLPLQILFINLILDVFPALALGVGGGHPSVMRRPPRDPSEPVLTPRHWLSIAAYGAVIALAVLGSLAIALFALGMPQQGAVTVSFLTLGFARLWHVFNMRDAGTPLFRNEVARNRFVWGAIALCAGLLAATVLFPPLSVLLRVTDPGFHGWTLILGMSLLPLAAGQVYRTVRGR